MSVFERACHQNGLYICDREKELQIVANLIVSTTLSQVFAHDDDVFEKIAAEERRAEFFGRGSSEEMWDQRDQEAHSDNEAILKRRGKESVEKDLCLQLSGKMSESGLWDKDPGERSATAWEKDSEQASRIFVAGNSSILKHTSSEESSRIIKTSNLSLGSKEFLSLKKNRRISKISKTSRSYSLTKAKDYKKRAKRTKFTTTSESEEVGCSSEIDCLRDNDITSSLINTTTDSIETKKKRKEKKTPMEFEKRLIAGTKRYYMTKLEKMKSKINLDGNQISSDPELRSSFQDSGRDLTRDESSEPVSLVSIPSQTCQSPLLLSWEGQENGVGYSGSATSKKLTPFPTCQGTEGRQNSPHAGGYRRGSSTSTTAHSNCAVSRPNSSCVISISRLKNVRVGPSIKERFCNSLVFIDKPNKPERSKLINESEENTSSSVNDAFAAQLKASKIKLHRELALEEKLTPSLTPAWTFSYMSPTSPSYSEYINNVDIHT